MRRLRWLALSVCVVWLAGCATTRPPGVVAQPHGTAAFTLQAQLDAITQDALAPQARRVIFIGAALNGREDVFDRDVRAMDAALRQVYGAAYRSVLLSNIRVAQPPRSLPLATIDHLDDVFDTLAERRRAGDRFIILLATHGHRHLLEVEQAARYPQPRLLNTDKLAAWAKLLGPAPSWWMVSACFSGSHLSALTQNHVLVMTASSADRPSFGCSDQLPNTWFVHELLAALRAQRSERPAPSLAQVWQAAQSGIQKRELALKVDPSQPQMAAGALMEARLHGPLEAF
jgi:Peptidase C13 family